MRSLRKVRLMTIIVAAFTIGVLPSGMTRAATASTSVVSSYAKANDAADGSMIQISLGFKVPVDHQRSTLILRSVRGDRQLRPRLDSSPNYLFSIVGRLPPGDYELVWEARLSDGQQSSGTLSFTAKPGQDTALVTNHLPQGNEIAARPFRATT